MKSTKIGVVGLGYVGLTFAISLAKRGFKVNGYENNLNTFKLLSSGKAQFYEENIDKDLKKILKNKKLKIFKNLDNIKDCNLVFITVGTPIGENKKVNLYQGDVYTVKKNTVHSFKTKKGVIFEEIATRYIKGDSKYLDKKIDKDRKTQINIFD